MRAVRDVAKSFVTWVILLALAIDALAVPVEPVLLLEGGAPVGAAAAATLAALGLSTLFAMLAAVPVACVYALVRLVGRAPKPWSLAWPLPLVGLAWLVVQDLAPDPFVDLKVRWEARLFLFAALAGLLVVATRITHIVKLQNRLMAGVPLATMMLAIILSLPPTIHREPRDVAWLCLIVSAAAILYPLRRHMKSLPNERVARAFGALLGLSLLLLAAAKVTCPNWRVYARDYGRVAERLGRFVRKVVDLDGDGFSSVLGGTDCDDWDESRNPIVAELPDGKDRNCNGLTRPAVPTPAQLGLLPAQGEPDADPHGVDRVVLITVDCFRHDALDPDVTPNLLRLSGRGVTFTKLYAGGARTTVSLPIVMRSAFGRPSVATTLAAAGVGSAAIVAYRHSTIGDNVLEGFRTATLPAKIDKRFRASETTDAALADLRDPANARRHFLWVHYFDAHGPRARRVLPPDVPSPPPFPGEEPESSLYLSEIAYDDREIGRLLRGIEETGGFDRTVVLVTGDHGEAFGAHEEYEHGQSPFEQVVHVPGILVAPGLAPGRYEHVVTHRDVAATILGAFGLVAGHPEIEDFGRSWLRLRAARDAPLHRFVITYSTSSHVQQWADAPMIVRTDDRAKLAIGYREGIQRLYHLDTPEREDREVSHEFPEETARDRLELEAYREVDRCPP